MHIPLPCVSHYNKEGRPLGTESETYFPQQWLAERECYNPTHLPISPPNFHSKPSKSTISYKPSVCSQSLSKNIFLNPTFWNDQHSLGAFSCSSRDNRENLVASRDNGKSPRGQDWGLPGALLRLYILHRGLAMCTLDRTICYATWLLHESYMRIAGVSVQPCNGIEANHEGKMR